MNETDAIGRKILRELSHEGRISNLELAERVGLSPSACLLRVQELARSGVIRGYRARLDPARVGTGFITSVAFSLSPHTKDAQSRLVADEAPATEWRQCQTTTGPT